MATYLYCSDSGVAGPTVRVSDLTPRCWFAAASRAEAREMLAAIEAARYPTGRQFGAAGIRQETARERARVVSPSEVLPEVDEYLDRDAA